MTNEPRPIRDILAECLRRERIGLVRPLWADWASFADDECEHVRRRADHLVRLLAEHGVTIVRTGDASPLPPPSSPVIWQSHLVGRNAQRIVRKAAGETWEIATAEAGAEKIEFTFTMDEVTGYAGLVLTDDPEALKIKGIGRLLAAQNEIYRLDAAAIEAPK